MIKKTEEPDIIVGIPSYNEADNIAFVASQLSLGLKRYFPAHSSVSVIINVDYKSIKKESIEGFSEKESLLTSIMYRPHYHATKKMHISERWNIWPGLWTKILYDFIFAYETSGNKEEVVDALKPLYFARAASFYRQTLDLNHQESEEKILGQAKQFHKSRRYLFNKFITA